MPRRIRFRLNGEWVELDVEPNELLLNVLREKLGLTGTKYGCGIGGCGTCTVLVDGEPVLSCLTLAVDVDGRDVVTIEGLTTTLTNLYFVPNNALFIQFIRYINGASADPSIHQAGSPLQQYQHLRGGRTDVLHRPIKPGQSLCLSSVLLPRWRLIRNMQILMEKYR